MDNNPLMRNDPDGKDTRVKTRRKRNGGTHTRIVYRGVLIDRTGKMTKRDMRKYKREIKKQLQESFTGNEGQDSWDIKVKLRTGKKPRSLRKDNVKGERVRESTISLVETGYNLGAGREIMPGESTHMGTYDAYVNILATENIAQTGAHEVGHTMGLPHILNPMPENGSEYIFDVSPSILFGKSSQVPDGVLDGNLMMNGPFSGSNSRLNGTKVSRSQIEHIRQDYENGKLNSDEFNGSDEPWGIYPTDTPVYKFRYSPVLKVTTLNRYD